MTVTLAWISPIAPNTQKYRKSSLWFDVGTKPLGTSRRDVEWTTTKRGTVQHEIFEGDEILTYSDGENLSIKVNCRKDAGTRLENPIKYGLFVSLEVAEGLDIPIYNEIRARIITPIPIHPRLRDSDQNTVVERAN